MPPFVPPVIGGRAPDQTPWSAVWAVPAKRCSTKARRGPITRCVRGGAATVGEAEAVSWRL
jgi:hypothetical protein